MMSLVDCLGMLQHSVKSCLGMLQHSVKSCLGMLQHSVMSCLGMLQHSVMSCLGMLQHSVKSCLGMLQHSVKSFASITQFLQWHLTTLGQSFSITYMAFLSSLTMNTIILSSQNKQCHMFDSIFARNTKVKLITEIWQGISLTEIHYCIFWVAYILSGYQFLLLYCVFITFLIS